MVFRRVSEIKPLWAWGWWGSGQTFARRSDLQRLEGTIELDRLVPAGEEDLDRNALVALPRSGPPSCSSRAASGCYDELAWIYEQQGLTERAAGRTGESARLLPVYDQHGWRPVAISPKRIYRAIVAGMDAAATAPHSLNPDLIQREIGRIASVRGDLAEAEKRYRLARAASQEADGGRHRRRPRGDPAPRREDHGSPCPCSRRRPRERSSDGPRGSPSRASVPRPGNGPARRKRFAPRSGSSRRRLGPARARQGARRDGDRAAAIGRLEDAERIGVATAESASSGYDCCSRKDGWARRWPARRGSRRITRAAGT